MNPSESQPNERRSFKRHSVRCDASLTPVNVKDTVPSPHEITVLDISRNGALLLSNQPLESGTQWKLNILDKGYVYHTQTVIIKHVEQDEEASSCIAGVMFVLDPAVFQFLNVDPDEHMDQFLESFDDILSL